MTRAFTILFVVALVASRCTYHDERRESRIQSVIARPESDQLAAAVVHRAVRHPRGLARFPDGGRPRVRAQSVILYMCDVSDRSVREVARIAAPRNLTTAFAVHLDGWLGSDLVLTLSGCSGVECYDGLLIRQHFRLPPGNLPVRLDRLPDNLARTPGMLTRAEGERTYLRVSAGHSEIRARSIAADGVVGPLRSLTARRCVFARGE